MLAVNLRISKQCAALQDPVHKLAWTLDACVNDRSLDSRRLRELQNFFAPHDTAGAMPPPPTARTAKRHKHKCGRLHV